MSLEKNKKPSKSVFIGKTIEMMKEQFKDDPVLTKSLTSVLDSVAHTAPEIVENRWYDIYKLAVNYINDENNPAHMEAFRIYNSRFNKYKELYINNN
jgi:hypothetical protein